MNTSWRITGRILLALILIAGAALLGLYTYNLGLAQGLAESGALAGGEAGVRPFLGRPYGPWGFGFGFLGCLIPLFFGFLFFALLRGLFWRRHWRGDPGHPGKWHSEHGVPPMFEAWHRRAHGEEPEQEEGTSSPA